jgi:hypothetical protein
LCSARHGTPLRQALKLPRLTICIRGFVLKRAPISKADHGPGIQQFVTAHLRQGRLFRVPGGGKVRYLAWLAAA